MVCDAKIIISPWGFGELSHKDEEAHWCRSIVVRDLKAILLLFFNRESLSCVFLQYFCMIT